MGFGKGLVTGAILTLIVLAAAVYFYFGSGLAPVATSAAPMPFEKFLANRGLHAAIAKTADRPSPVDAGEPHLQSGATIYRANCAVCHGLPGQPESNIAGGMFPKPPQLFQGKGVTDDPVGETFWKVQNGIRLTGMPGFEGRLTDDQMWEVSQLLAHADKLPAGVQAGLTRKE